MFCLNMGCISSKRRSAANLFEVVNVDDYGTQANEGQLEVTESEIVFYRRGQTPTRWPLRTLRRYGCENDFFSFESGRRSPTGAGVYAFHCKRAGQLVALLEMNLQVKAHNESDCEGNRRISHRLSSISSGGPLSPLTNIPPVVDNLPIPRPPSQNLYANDAIIAATATTSDPQDETNNNKIVETNGVNRAPLAQEEIVEGAVPGHLYMNIVPGTENQVAENKASTEFQTTPPALQVPPWEPEEPHCYANLDVDSELDPSSRTLNYITLDLETPKTPTASPPPDSPRRPPQGYATIDFDRTTALSHSVDPSFDDSESSRRTRHNSQITELPRLSSSVSD